MSATVYRTVLGGFTPNRVTIIGWNAINIALLVEYLWLQWRAGRGRLGRRPPGAPSGWGMIAYPIWTLFVLIWLMALVTRRAEGRRDRLAGPRLWQGSRLAASGREPSSAVGAMPAAAGTSANKDRDAPRQDRHQGRPRAQPQEHRRGDPARQAGGHHRPVRLGQVQPGLRHHLRRGPAPLRGVPLRLRPPVPGPDGEARRGLHRRPVPGHLHRPEGHLATTRAPPWAPSPRSTTTCACSSPASATRTARSAAGRSSSRRPSRSSTPCWPCPTAAASWCWRR